MIQFQVGFLPQNDSNLEPIPSKHESNHHELRMYKMMNNYTKMKPCASADEDKTDSVEDEQMAINKARVMSRIDFMRNNELSDRSISPHSQSIYSRQAHNLTHNTPTQGRVPQKNSSSKWISMSSRFKFWLL
jgi:hypothetical protein